MWNTTKMTSEQWCEAVDAENCGGPLARMAARRRVPVGVDMNDPEVARRIWQCVCILARRPDQRDLLAAPPPPDSLPVIDGRYYLG